MNYTRELHIWKKKYSSTEMDYPEELTTFTFLKESSSQVLNS